MDQSSQNYNPNHLSQQQSLSLSQHQHHTVFKTHQHPSQGFSPAISMSKTTKTEIESSTSSTLSSPPQRTSPPQQTSSQTTVNQHHSPQQSPSTVIADFNDFTHQITQSIVGPNGEELSPTELQLYYQSILAHKTIQEELYQVQLFQHNAEKELAQALYRSKRQILDEKDQIAREKEFALEQRITSLHQNLMSTVNNRIDYLHDIKMKNHQLAGLALKIAQIPQSQRDLTDPFITHFRQSLQQPQPMLISTTSSSSSSPPQLLSSNDTSPFGKFNMMTSTSTSKPSVFPPQQLTLATSSTSSGHNSMNDNDDNNTSTTSFQQKQKQQQEEEKSISYLLLSGHFNKELGIGSNDDDNDNAYGGTKRNRNRNQYSLHSQSTLNPIPSLSTTTSTRPTSRIGKSSSRLPPPPSSTTTKTTTTTTPPTKSAPPISIISPPQRSTSIILTEQIIPSPTVSRSQSQSKSTKFQHKLVGFNFESNTDDLFSMDENDNNEDDDDEYNEDDDADDDDDEHTSKSRRKSTSKKGKSPGNKGRKNLTQIQNNQHNINDDDDDSLFDTEQEEDDGSKSPSKLPSKLPTNTPTKTKSRRTSLTQVIQYLPKHQPHIDKDVNYFLSYIFPKDTLERACRRKLDFTTRFYCLICKTRVKNAELHALNHQQYFSTTTPHPISKVKSCHECCLQSNSSITSHFNSHDGNKALLKEYPILDKKFKPLSPEQVQLIYLQHRDNDNHEDNDEINDQNNDEVNGENNHEDSGQGIEVEATHDDNDQKVLKQHKRQRGAKIHNTVSNITNTNTNANLNQRTKRSTKMKMNDKSDDESDNENDDNEDNHGNISDIGNDDNDNNIGFDDNQSFSNSEHEDVQQEELNSNTKTVNQSHDGKPYKYYYDKIKPITKRLSKSALSRIELLFEDFPHIRDTHTHYCKICTSTLESDDVQIHAQCHYNWFDLDVPEDSKISCSKCFFTFDTVGDLNHHFKNDPLCPKNVHNLHNINNDDDENNNDLNDTMNDNDDVDDVESDSGDDDTVVIHRNTPTTTPIKSIDKLQQQQSEVLKAHIVPFSSLPKQVQNDIVHHDDLYITIPPDRSDISLCLCCKYLINNYNSSKHLYGHYQYYTNIDDIDEADDSSDICHKRHLVLNRHDDNTSDRELDSLNNCTSILLQHKKNLPKHYFTPYDSARIASAKILSQLPPPSYPKISQASQLQFPQSQLQSQSSQAPITTMKNDSSPGLSSTTLPAPNVKPLQSKPIASSKSTVATKSSKNITNTTMSIYSDAEDDNDNDINSNSDDDLLHINNISVHGSDDDVVIDSTTIHDRFALDDDDFEITSILDCILGEDYINSSKQNKVNNDDDKASLPQTKVKNDTIISPQKNKVNTDNVHSGKIISPTHNKKATPIFDGNCIELDMSSQSQSQPAHIRTKKLTFVKSSSKTFSSPPTFNKQSITNSHNDDDDDEKHSQLLTPPDILHKMTMISKGSCLTHNNHINTNRLIPKRFQSPTLSSLSLTQSSQSSQPTSKPTSHNSSPIQTISLLSSEPISPSSSLTPQVRNNDSQIDYSQIY